MSEVYPGVANITHEGGDDVEDGLDSQDDTLVLALHVGQEVNNTV